MLDGQGTVQLWSPAVADLSGLPAAAAQGRPLREVVAALGPDGTPCNPFLVGRAQLSPESPQTTVEITVLRHDGEQRVVRCAHAAVFDDDGELQRDVVMLHDVTRERQVERLKADFIATVSHELRTPVTPIKGYADLLRRRGDVMTPEKRSECLDIISDRAGHLARLVEDLLLASRISATEGSSPAQVDMGLGELGQLVRRACGDFDERRLAGRARPARGGGAGRLRPGPHDPGADQPRRQRAEVLHPRHPGARPPAGRGRPAPGSRSRTAAAASRPTSSSGSSRSSTGSRTRCA